MNRKAQRMQGKAALELLEEAVHLLRRLPGSAFASYYAGSALFVLGFLYFWADMSRGAFAGRHVVQASFLLSLLFIWMKCWQTVFASQIRALLAGDREPGWPFRRILRLVLAQTAIQPVGVFLLPAALLVTLPFGWVYAYYQNVTVYGNGEIQDLRTVAGKARGQAMLFQNQNHVVLAVLALFSLFVFVNIAVLLYLAPQLLQTLSGIENVFTRARWTLLNTSFLAAVTGMTYLAVDPVVKSVYVLRCFYGESILTGEDLKAELGTTGYGVKTASAALALVLALFAASPAPAQERVTAEKLDRSITEVIRKPEYAWRMPREKQVKPAEDARGPFAEFLYGAADTVTAWLRPVKKWIGKALTWLAEQVLSRLKVDPGQTPRQGEWPRSVFVLLYALLTAAVSVLAVMLLRMWQRRGTGSGPLNGAGTLQMPDLTREDVSADALPVDGWLELGADLMRQGDRRLALRAYYLASLSRLAEQGRITIALFKSNREYERELGRKAHTLPGLVSAFSQNVGMFERIWYGTYDVTADMLLRFTENQKRIMENAQDA